MRLYVGVLLNEMDGGNVHRKKGQMYEGRIRNVESTLCASWK